MLMLMRNVQQPLRKMLIMRYLPLPIQTRERRERYRYTLNDDARDYEGCSVSTRMMSPS